MGKKVYPSILGTLTLLGCFLGLPMAAAYAEGSQDLVSSGGSRPYLEFRTDTNGGIPRRTIIKVYANEGETINLGSSAVGFGQGIINYRKPNNTAGSCGSAGLIANRAQEIAGPGVTGNEFVPCTVTVGAGESGIWEVDFVSPDPNSISNPTARPATANWTQSSTSGLVSAWDATVTSSAGAKIKGRVYANYYAFNIGGNGAGRSISSKFYVLTKEGYQYGIDLNGLDPYGFIFFANRNGFFETGSGDSIFRSLQFVGENPGQLPAGYDFQNPNDLDVGVYVTHKTFINLPDSTMPAAASSPKGMTWLYSQPLLPPIPSNFGFTGIEGTNGQAGTTPLGGRLSFDSNSQSAFSITIDLNGDGDYGNANDRTFVGRSVVGANSVFWDGLDGNGVPVPASSIPYNVKINQYAGEAHFPIIDAEQGPRGIILERLNQPAGLTNLSDDPFDLYYDDRNTGADFTLCATGETGADCYGNGPNPREALTGESSRTTGAHQFTNNFGDRRGIDTWVYYPSRDVELVGGIVIKEADLIVDKTVDLATANPGDLLTYTVTVKNDGPSDEPGIGFEDLVPAVIANVSWSCAITSAAGTGSCGEASGTGNAINTTLDLNNQAVATYTITGTLSSSASGTITNTAKAVRNKDITDPNKDNNTDDAITVLNSAPPPVGSFCYLIANSNNALVKVDIRTGAEATVSSSIPGNGSIKAIAYRSSDNSLFVSRGQRLAVYDTFDNSYGNLPRTIGSVGPDVPAVLEGLAFHPFTGELFGSVRNRNGADSLIKIDPTTGGFVPGAFEGADFLTIAAAGPGNVGDIAFDTQTGELYAIANQTGTVSDQLVKVDLTNGSTTLVGNLGVNRVESLSVFNDGSFYGSTGNASLPTTDRNRFYGINKVSGAATPIGNAALTAGQAYESAACATEAANNITGTVFLDPDTSGTISGGDTGTADASVRLYRDANGNGQVDGSDILLASRLSTGDGTFGFSFPANGSFVLDVDSATLPPSNSVFTTDNVETANFGSSFGITDANNDFGHFTNSNLAIVKRITAINGNQITDSVDDPTSDDDNHPNWPTGQSGAGVSTFLAGATQTNVEPGDVVEYTVYYLATGNFPITNVKLCDRVPESTDYIPESMVLFTNSSTSNLTDTNIDGDGGELLLAGDNSPAPCPGSNTNGTVLVNLAPSPSQLPNATGPGTPTNAYGFIRFRVTVE